jgi:hypothetical protein
MQDRQPFSLAIDLEIIMMGYAHFDGDFFKMKETLDANPAHPLHSFPNERLEEIFSFMERSPQNLLDTLPQKAKEAVEEAKRFSKKMEQTIQEHPDSIEAKVNELIFYVGENPFLLIDDLVMEGSEALPELLKVLKNTHLYDPLYPGYGRSIPRIADALQGIQDKKAISPLFNALLEQNSLAEDPLLEALVSFGEDAQQFLLKILEERPFSLRSSYAAKALYFLKSADVGFAAIDLLCDKEIYKHPGFMLYLIALLDALPDAERPSLIRQLLEETHFSSTHRKEIESFLVVQS